MTPDVTVFTVEKAGNSEDENEDRVAWAVGEQNLRVGVADGATESSFSDLWAAALVGAWVAGPRVQVNHDYLAVAKDSWTKSLPRVDELPWYAQEKLAEGAHSTLAGIDLRLATGRMRWRAQFVGDCQIFVLKPAKSLKLVRTAPATGSEDFGFHPELVGTDPTTWRALRPVETTGQIRQPFELWIATDALAAAWLVAQERGQPCWDEWATAMGHHATFGQIVSTWREQGRLRNDDTTVCRIRMS